MPYSWIRVRAEAEEMTSKARAPSAQGNPSNSGARRQCELMRGYLDFEALVALHLQHGEPARLPRPAGSGAQQRRLPAAGPVSGAILPTSGA